MSQSSRKPYVAHPPRWIQLTARS